VDIQNRLSLESMKVSGSLAARWLLPFVGAASILMLLVAPIGLGPTALAHALENAFHAPLFALIAVGLVVWLHRISAWTSSWALYLLALLIAVVLGALGEIAQSLTATRHAEWIDLTNDFLGAFAGLCVYSLYDKQRRLAARVRGAAYVLAVVAVTIVAAPVAHLAFVYCQRWQQLPELVTWNSPAGYHFAKPNSADLRVMYLPPELAATGERVLEVKPRRAGRWVGVSIEEPWPDWSGYAWLTIEVVNPNDRPLALLLRINDRAHNNEFDDRFNRRFAVAARERAVLEVPLSEVQVSPKSRQMDLKKVAQLIIFQDAERGAYPFYLHSARLEP
jgi:hypothetical protein